MDLQQSEDCIATICELMVQKRNHFLTLYRPYCQNKPLSEALRKVGDFQFDHCKFFIVIFKHLIKLGNVFLGVSKTRWTFVAIKCLLYVFLILKIDFSIKTNSTNNKISIAFKEIVTLF